MRRRYNIFVFSYKALGYALWIIYLAKCLKLNHRAVNLALDHAPSSLTLVFKSSRVFNVPERGDS